MGRPGYINLTSFGDVRRFLSKLINERRTGEIGSEKYRDLVFGASKLQNVLEAIYIRTEIEARLERLERPGQRPAFGTYRESVDGESTKKHEGQH